MRLETCQLGGMLHLHWIYEVNVNMTNPPSFFLLRFLEFFWHFDMNETRTQLVSLKTSTRKCQLVYGFTSCLHMIIIVLLLLSLYLLQVGRQVA